MSEPVTTVARKVLVSLATALGYDPADVRSIHITAEYVQVTAYRRDAQGLKVPKNGRYLETVTTIGVED